MFGRQYIKDAIEVAKSANKMKSCQFFRYFPTSIQNIYALMEGAGFSSSAYRNSWPDLRINLPSDAWSTCHFVEYIESEVKLARRFPIHLDLIGLKKLAGATILSKFAKSSLIRGLIQAQMDYDTTILEDPLFWLEIINMLSSLGSPVLVFGDSHSLIYRQTVRDRGNRMIIPLNVLCGGGSASGLPNANSISGYGNMIRRVTAAINAAHQSGARDLPVLFAFGQVDLEFVHTYRRLRSESYTFDPAILETFTADLANKYIDWIADLHLRRPIVAGINPPCIDDIYIYESYFAQMQVYVAGRIVDENFDGIMQNFDRLEFPSKQQRTSIHAKLNAILRQASRRAGLAYTDIFAEMLGVDGCIKTNYACASDGTALHVGLTGKDIHVGGEHARQAKASLLRSIPGLAVKQPHTLS